MSAVATAATTVARATSKPFTRVGVVVTAGLMPKMIKVRVPSPIWNSKLRKYFHHTKDHLTHDEYSACQAGDIVRIQPFQKHSKSKKHVVYEVISPFGTGERTPIETPEEREVRIKQETEKRQARKVKRVAERDAKSGKRKHKADEAAETEVVKEGTETTLAA